MGCRAWTGSVEVMATSVGYNTALPHDMCTLSTFQDFGVEDEWPVVAEHFGQVRATVLFSVTFVCGLAALSPNQPHRPRTFTRT